MSRCSHAASGCNYPEGECAGVCTAKAEPMIFVKFTRSIDGVGLTVEEFEVMKQWLGNLMPVRPDERSPLHLALEKLRIAASRVICP